MHKLWWKNRVNVTVKESLTQSLWKIVEKIARRKVGYKGFKLGGGAG